MTDDLLTAAVAALERVPATVAWADVERRLDDDDPPAEPDPERRTAGGRRRVTAALVAATAAVAMVVVAIVAWPDSGPEPVHTGPGSTETPSTSSGPSSSTTTAPPTSSFRSSAVTAFTGSDYLVWGGEAGNDALRADGFAVDVATGDVRPIPAAPIDPRSGATGVWTGSELIVCCGAGAADDVEPPADSRSAAAWDPVTGAWRTLARPPASVARWAPASVWTGELMIVVANWPAVATYDPDTDRWTEVAAPPAFDLHPEAVWTGTEVIVWDARYGMGQVPPTDEVADRGWRWAPGRAEWEALPDLPPGSRTRLGSIGWTGTEVVVWGESTGADGRGVGARWRPGDDAWRPVSPSPQGDVEPYDGTPGSQAVVSDPDRGRVLVRALDGDTAPPPLLAYDPATDAWIVADVTVPGYHPPLTLAQGTLLVPDQADPIVGPAPG